MIQPELSVTLWAGRDLNIATCCSIAASGLWCASGRRERSDCLTQRGSLLSIALDGLSLGRAALGIALSTRARRITTGTCTTTGAARDHFERAVAGLREAEHNNELTRWDFAARAALCRALRRLGRRRARSRRGRGNRRAGADAALFVRYGARSGCGWRWRRAKRLRRSTGSSTTARQSRSRRTRRSATDCSPRPRKQLRIAADYIATCGYHRRDEELAELQAVVRGDRTFASLPPRV